MKFTKENLPNNLTIARIFAIPVFLLIIVLGGHSQMWQIVAAVLFAVASATDWLDGYLARKWHIVSNFGKFADPLADKMLVMAAFIMLVPLSKTFVICAVASLAMPLGLNTIVIPAGYGKDTTMASGMALISHVLAVITIPLIFLLFNYVV